MYFPLILSLVILLSTCIRYIWSIMQWTGSLAGHPMKTDLTIYKMFYWSIIVLYWNTLRPTKLECDLFLTVTKVTTLWIKYTCSLMLTLVYRSFYKLFQYIHNQFMVLTCGSPAGFLNMWKWNLFLFKAFCPRLCPWTLSMSICHLKFKRNSSWHCLSIDEILTTNLLI